MCIMIRAAAQCDQAHKMHTLAAGGAVLGRAVLTGGGGVQAAAEAFGDALRRLVPPHVATSRCRDTGDSEEAAWEESVACMAMRLPHGGV